MRNTFLATACSVGLFVLGCGPSGLDTGEEKPSYACDVSAPPTRWASCVESFEPGDAAGFGAELYPDVIFGEPLGNGNTQGSTDVLSLGRDGVITLGFGGNAIIDGPGIDFVVFENAFLYGPMGNQVFRELGEISVSLDGQTWVTFPCDAEATPPAGCAGHAPVFANGDLGISSIDPAISGGDQFDLATTGLGEVRFVRIRDVEGIGAAPTAGFDLDAIAIVNAKIP